MERESRNENSNGERTEQSAREDALPNERGGEVNRGALDRGLLGKKTFLLAFAVGFCLIHLA